MSRILVVDDEPDLLFILRRTLTRAGHEVIVACDGAVALASVRQSPPDLVVTHIMMPVMSGVELIRALRADPATASIPILSVSGDWRSAPTPRWPSPINGKDLHRGRGPAAGRTWHEMKWLSTGLADLDLILGGGLEPGSVVVLAGPPGAGKTILAQQICFANATAEHKAVYYTTLTEPHSKLVEHLQGFAFFDPAALGPKVEYVHLGNMLRDTESGNLEPLIDEVVRKSLDDQPTLVVIDSVKMLRDFVSDHVLRMTLYDLTSRVAHSKAVLLLLGEYTAKDMKTGVEFSLADGIVHLSHKQRDPVDRRGLRVVKMRAASHLGGAHTVHITDDGFQVYPRVESFLTAEVPPTSGRVACGIPGLDALMGGGVPESDATLVLGPSGAGKTIACLRFVAEGLARDERCLYITFQDTADQLVGMAGKFGWDFTTARDSGRLVISHVPVGNLDLDVLASVIRHGLADGTTIRIVVDSLAEMVQAAREAQRFPAYLRSLVGVVRAAGANLWVTSETRTFGPMDEPLSGLMFLFHNVLQIRYIEHCDEVGRAINVFKMRNSNHDNRLHACHITDDGVTVGDRLEGLTGQLGWSALRDCPHHSQAHQSARPD